MTVGNASYSTNVATMTLQHFSNEIFDNVVTNNAALNELKKKGNIKVVSGGRTFNHPVYHLQNANFDSMAKTGTVGTTAYDSFSRAEYDVRVIAGSVVYNLVEEAMNAGNKEKLIDYIEALKMDAEVSMGEVMGDQVMQAEASVVRSSDFDSIPLLISDDPSAATIDPGGIEADSAGNSWWRNYTYATTISSFTGASAGLTGMDTVLNQCTKGRQGPTFIITTKNIFTYYMLSLQANVRYQQLDTGDGAFKRLQYATLPVMADDNCPDDHMYFIDGNALKLQVLAQGNMKMTSMLDSYTTLSARSILYFLGNITCGSRRTQGVLTSITGA